MKKITICLLVLTMVLLITLASAKARSDGLLTSNGVDIFRGAWAGELNLIDDEEIVQINLYFSEAVAIDEVHFKTSGYFSYDELGGPKRSKALKLPMMAEVKDLGDGTYELLILANVMVPAEGEETEIIIVKLTATAEMNGSGVTDDTLEGRWYLPGPDGELMEEEWSAVHLDRRIVEPSEIIPEPPLNFQGDLKIHLFGPGEPTTIEDRDPVYCFDIVTNIVMDNVRVTYPGSESVTLIPYTDVFSLGVDWITQFRFTLNIPGLPLQGQFYTFTALDVAGNPIPVVESTDMWVGVDPPDPPINVQSEVIDEGIYLSWDPVTPVPGSFEPGNNIGWYQMEVRNEMHESTFGASSISIPEHVIPKNQEDFLPGKDWGMPLSEMPDGTYTINVNVHCIAPEDSEGSGFEYSSQDPDERITFIINNGEIIIP